MGPKKMKDESVVAAVEITGASLASKTTTAGAGIAGFGWWFSSEAAVFVGILIGVAGYLTNLYFQRRREKREMEFKQKDEDRKQRQDEREQREHEARMRSYGARP